MSIETRPVSQPDNNSSSTGVLRNREKKTVTKKPPKDTQLLAYADRLFTPLMAHASADASGKLIAEPFFLDLGVSDAEMLARYREFEKSGFQMSVVQPAASPVKAASGKIMPCRGLGPGVIIGFDAEWEYREVGRNQVLSIQFHLIGPTGAAIGLVIHLHGDDVIEERPSLAQSIADLLEMGLDEGVIEEWPDEVLLSGFLTRADITLFSDFKKIRHEFDGVGGTLVSIKGTATVELPLQPDTELRLKRRYTAIVGDQFDPRLLNIRLIDASRLAPPGTSLKSLGNWIGLPKLDLPKGMAKNKMSEFQRKDRKRFEAYGLRDAEIAAYYVLWVLWFSNRHLGLQGFSATIGGLAVRVSEACMLRDGVSPDVALNFEQLEYPRWNNKTNRAVTRKERVPKRIRHWLEPFMADAFMGGRNECYVFGPTEIKRFYDPDLSGAYVTGLSYLKTLDYDRAMMTKVVSDYFGHVAGFALVEFQFPEGTRHPGLPVRIGDGGLIYTLRGESLCTAPEIELAFAMGAQIEIKFGWVIPWMDRTTVFQRSRVKLAKAARKAGSAAPDVPPAGTSGGVAAFNKVLPTDPDGDGYRPFESFTLYIRDNRAKYRRKTLPFEFFKVLGNSDYGKIGQGYKGKRTFDPREMGSVIVGTSRISEAGLAALVCGFIRAVLSEILWKLPPETTVVSATTDGFLLDMPLESLDLSGVMCQRFQSLVERVSPGVSMLECKHQVMQILAMRTRGQLTGLCDGNSPYVTAKAGVKLDPAIEDENGYMVDLFLNREAGQVMPRPSLISMRDQLTRGWDLQTETSDVKLNLEFDFKRRPVNPRMREVANGKGDHLAFETVPWNCAEDALLARVLFYVWRQTRCLKTLADWDDWQAFYAFHRNNRLRASQKQESLEVGADIDNVALRKRGASGRVYKTRSGYLGVAIRTFLTAFVQRAWGMADVNVSQAQLEVWMQQVGYAIKLSAIKNAGSALLNEQVVPATEEVKAFLQTLKTQFPTLEIERFLIAPA